jgi:hypothetical protein
MPDVKIKTEVTGSVWKIEKQVGDKVEPGDAVMVLESMKMEIRCWWRIPARWWKFSSSRAMPSAKATWSPY